MEREDHLPARPPSCSSLDGAAVFLDLRNFRNIAHQIDDRLYIGVPKGAPSLQLHLWGELAGPEELSVFPDPRFRIVRPNPTGIGPGMDRNQLRGDCRSNMHRAAVDTDDEARRADEPDQLEERGLIQQIHAIFRYADSARRPADDDDAYGVECFAEFLDDGVSQRFPIPPRERMEQNEWRKRVETGQRVARRQREAELFGDCGAEGFRELQVAIDRVRSSIHFRGMPVKQPRTFSAIAHSPELPGAADFSDECTAQEALKIKGRVRSQSPRFLEPGPESARRVQAAELPARKNMNVVHVGIAPEQGGPFRIDHPGNFRPRMRVADRRDRRQGVDDVTKRARLDDQDGAKFRFQISDFRSVLAQSAI
jgi:hypothetical protein